MIGAQIIDCQDDLVHIVVDTKIESLNRFIGSSGRSQFFAYKKYKAGWERALKALPLKERTPILGYTHIISYRNRLLDKENLYGGAKPIRHTMMPKIWLGTYN